MNRFKSFLVVPTFCSLAMTAGADNIQQMKAQLDRMQKQIIDLQNAKPAPLSSASSNISTQKKVRLKIGGHANVMSAYADDGDKSGVLHMTNDTSTSRAHFVAEGDVNEQVTMQALITLGFRVNKSSTTGLRSSSSSDIDIRKAEVGIRTRHYGDLFIGKGKTATDDTGEQGYISGTGIADSIYATMGLQFVDKQNRNNIVEGPHVGDVYSTMDGHLSRTVRVRYDSPTFHGIKVRVDHSSNNGKNFGTKRQSMHNNYGGAVLYKQMFGGTEVRAAVAYARLEKGQNSSYNQPASSSRLNGSFGVAFSSGVNVSAYAGHEKFNKGIIDQAGVRANYSDAKTYHAKLGYKRKMFSWGQTCFAVNYGTSWNNNQQDLVNNGRVTYYGLSILQRIDKAASEVYLNVRNHKLKADKRHPNPRKYHDILAVFAGVRVKF